VRHIVTDNGSNFVKAFNEYSKEKETLTDDEYDNCDVFGYDCEEDIESVSNFNEEIVTLHDMLDKASDINVEEAEAEMFCILPPHIRCASHTLNLIGSTDAEKIIASNPSLYKLYRSAI
jgi:hypothetical protein